MEIAVYSSESAFANENSEISENGEFSEKKTTLKQLYADGWVLKQCTSSGKKLFFFMECEKMTNSKTDNLANSGE